MADNTAQNGTNTVATDDIGGVHYQIIKQAFGPLDTATLVSTTDPLPVGGNVANNAADSGNPVKVGGTYLATAVALDTGDRGDLRLGAYGRLQAGLGKTSSSLDGRNAVLYMQGDHDGGDSLNVLAAQAYVYNGATHDMLRGDTTAGVWAQLKAAIPAGSNVIGAVTQSGTWTATPPTITKGTQAATGFTVQPLRDAGRVIVNAATAIAGVTAVTAEALLSLNISRDGAATAAATTHAVTSGKRWRITGLVAGVRSSSAAVLSGRVALRINPSGAVTTTSPIIAIASMTQQAAALAEAGDTCVLSFPDGIEISGTMQVGLTQVCSAVTGVVYASLIGYEY